MIVHNYDECEKCLRKPACGYRNIGIPIGKRECDNFLDESEFVRIPCKVGDVVYTNINGTRLQNSFRVTHTDLFGFSNGIYDWTWFELGTTVFLTQEEAEKALAKSRDKSNAEE